MSANDPWSHWSTLDGLGLALFAMIPTSGFLDHLIARSPDYIRSIRLPRSIFDGVMQKAFEAVRDSDDGTVHIGRWLKVKTKMTWYPKADTYKIWYFLNELAQVARAQLGKSSECHRKVIGTSSECHRNVIGKSSECHRKVIGKSSECHSRMTRHVNSCTRG